MVNSAQRHDVPSLVDHMAMASLDDQLVTIWGGGEHVSVPGAPGPLIAWLLPELDTQVLFRAVEDCPNSFLSGQ